MPDLYIKKGKDYFMADIDTEYTEIDKEEYFNEKCLPLARQLMEACYLGGLPYYFTAVVKNNENETEYFSDGIMTGSHGIILKDDKIKYHMMINAGCIAKPPREEFDFDTDLLIPIEKNKNEDEEF